MIRSLLVLALLAALAVPADAQRRHRDSFAERGDFALAFSIDGLRLSDFESGIGGRYWVGDHTVLNASVGFDYQERTGVTVYDYYRGGIEGDRLAAYNPNTDVLTTRFTLGVEQHIGGSSRVSPFLGLRTSFGFARYDQDEVYYGYPPYCDPGPCTEPYPYVYTTEVDETTFGVAGALGAEVKLTDGLTLSAAHTLGLTYVNRDRTFPVFYDLPCPTCYVALNDVAPDDGSFVHVGTGTTSLTLSIYF